MRRNFYLICALLVPGLPDTLAAGLPYGKTIVESASYWQEEAPPGAARARADVAAASSDDVAVLRDRLDSQQLSAGPYAPALSETLTDIARALERAGDYDEAIDAWGRALHLTRVTEGLYSPTQGPLVRGILNNLRSQGDYLELDERYDYFFRLYGAGRAPWNGVRWSATMEYLRWQREALRRQLDDGPGLRLLELYELNEDIIEALQIPGSGASWEQVRDAVLSQLKTLYLIEELIVPVQAFGPVSQRDIRRRSDNPMEMDLRRERLENVQRSLLSRSRAHLDALLELVPPTEFLARAEIRLAQADWLQWHGRGSAARSAYEQLWRELIDAGYDERASDWFSKPRPLPDNGVFWTPGSNADAPLLFNIEVSASGRARASSDETPEGASTRASRMRRMLNAVSFRPQITEGKVSPGRLLRQSYLRLRR